MQINPKTIKNRFEKSMETYRQNAVVQKHTAVKLVSELKKIKSYFPSILELGCGAGILTEQIVKKIRFDKYFANDLTGKSKNYVSEFVPEFVFYEGNAKKVRQKVDLIASNALFQWFKNLDEISDICKNNLNKDGILAFSTFSPENFREVRDLTGISLEYKTAEELKTIFKKNFDILHVEEFEKVLSFENPLELLAHFKFTGVNSLGKQTFTQVKEFCSEYKKRYPKITLTYSPIIFICKKK